MAGLPLAATLSLEALLTLLIFRCCVAGRGLVGDSVVLALASALLLAFVPPALTCHGGTCVGDVGRGTIVAAVWDASADGGIRVALDHPMPAAPAAGQMLVTVRGASINPVDYKLGPVLASAPLARWFLMHGVGRDYAGTVKESNCDAFKAGDRVFGLTSPTLSGALQEVALVNCGSAARMPKKWAFHEASGLGVAAATSLYALQKHAVRKGDRLLVIGASGGCGSVGVQVGKALGAKVTGICSTSNVDLVKKLGAAEVVDYTRGIMHPKKFHGARAFDLVYDTVSSPEDMDYEPIANPWAKAGTTYVAINGAGADWVRTLASSAFGMELQRENYDLIVPEINTKLLSELARLADEGKLTPLVDRVTDGLEDKTLRDAVERLRSRRSKGKVSWRLGGRGGGGREGQGTARVL